MLLAIAELQDNYLKLRHHLAAAGYQLVAPMMASDQAQAVQVGRTICQECNNLLSYQIWVKGADCHRLAVCLECYTATEV
jgi:hypothetical protein